MSLNRWTRRMHRWGAIATFLPLGLVIVSGLILQLKKQSSWIQPATVVGTGTNPEISWDRLIESAISDPNANIQSWEDVDRVDVRPSRGIAKVRCKNRWELQIDLADGNILASNYRRSDFIESLHDGSFFSEGAKLWLFFPNGLILFGLWGSGIYLWLLPFLAKRRKKKRVRQKETSEDSIVASD